MSDFFQNIRNGYAYVANNAQHVSINYERLNAFCAELPDTPPPNVFDEAFHFSGTREDTISYVMVLDAINFGSGYKPFLRDEGVKFRENSIYYTVSTTLKNAYHANGALTADDLMSITHQQCAALSGIKPAGKYSNELLAAMTESLRQLGDLILSDYNGSFLQFIETHKRSVSSLVQALIKKPLYNDVHTYKGQEIAFLKRAQITAADLYLALREKEKGILNDIADLTMFADNAVPHVLKVQGVLKYAPKLDRRIQSVDLVTSGSEEEIEIRACAAHAVEKMIEIKKMRAMDLDHILWHHSVETDFYKQSEPHRTLTTDY